jgi:hypothetical protein
MNEKIEFHFVTRITIWVKISSIEISISSMNFQMKIRWNELHISCFFFEIQAIRTSWSKSASFRSHFKRFHYCRKKVTKTTLVVFYSKMKCGWVFLLWKICRSKSREDIKTPNSAA